MTMDTVLRWRVNENLYGPSRISAKTEIKDLLLQDSVLQRGEWDADTQRRNTWATTCSNNFKKPLPALYDTRGKAQSFAGGRHISSFVLGSNSNQRVSTTLKDFDRKWMKTPMKAQPDLGTSIPDFAEKYMSDKKFAHNGSIYKNSFGKAQRTDTSQNTKQRQQYTKDLRTTHFHLGSAQNNFDTETTYRYQPSVIPPGNAPASISAQALLETYRSNVFKEGDWNVLGQPSVRYSVTRNDFHIKPFASVDMEDNSVSPSLRQQMYKAVIDKCSAQGDSNATTTRLQMFAQYDTDRSGFITKDQLIAVLRGARPSTTDEEIDSLIEQYNPGNVGDRIDYSAFFKYLEGFHKQAVKSTRNIQPENYTGTHYMKTSYPNMNGNPLDDPNHRYYHISTHFQFGSHSEDLKSLYHKDFMMGKRELRSKPVQALPPMSSQVLPEADKIGVQTSTKQNDYADPSDEGRAVTQMIEQEKKKNKSRLTKQSIEISSNPMSALAYRQASVSGADYHSPPTQFRPMTPRRAPESRYRFLDTNGALPVPPADPYVSEQQDKFITLIDRELKANKIECLERVGDNRSSHFGLGTDSEPKGSEQHHEFSKMIPLDSSIPAAGKKQTSEQNYSHVYPSESVEREPHTQNGMTEVRVMQERLKEMNKIRHSIPRDSLTRGRKQPMSSVMKSDYCPPEQRSFTSAQQRTIDISRAKPFTSMDPHYFHYDHSKERTKLTTTGHDFARPDRLREKQGLIVS